MSTILIKNGKKSFELDLSKEALFAAIRVGGRGKLARSNSPNPNFRYLVGPVDINHMSCIFSFLIGPKINVFAIRKAKTPEPVRINWKKV